MLFLVACAPTDPGDSAEPAPIVAFIAPVEGEDASLDAGAVAVEIALENFSLVDAAKHNDGEARGHVGLLLDGVTQEDQRVERFTVAMETGPHSLVAQLYYESNEPVEPLAVATVSFTAVE
jgi:hypothetical protein